MLPLDPGHRRHMAEQGHKLDPEEEKDASWAEAFEQHEKDREAWLQSMRECHDRNDILLGNLERIERKVGGLYARLPQDQAG